MRGKTLDGIMSETIMAKGTSEVKKYMTRPYKCTGKMKRVYKMCMPSFHKPGLVIWIGHRN